MEFPSLGQHCSEPSCRQLDFLPVNCDSCKNTFCMDHYSYVRHNCPTSFTKNVQVPVCPLCNTLIPGKVDELPDIRVSRHIDADCKSDRAVSRRKVYANKCSVKGCKQKGLVPVVCDNCAQNYCLRHRHPLDHTCTKADTKPLGKAGIAAAMRNQRTTETKGGKSLMTSVSNGFNNFVGGGRSHAGYTPTSVQGNISEDAALQLALQASMSDSTGNSARAASNATSSSIPQFSQEQEDFLLAKAIAESEREAQAVGNGSNGNQRRGNNCQIT
ncbi:unnamed protein product [Allacma fusca]|uniref:AN1-type domain-containing protein n=1 Tax=Allacma fusca TaxID=39272 RepID=A0A8J2JLT0_9HEXA|nr:unnamed protein product [Allacma fusca]